MKDYVIYTALIILSIGIYLSKINDAIIYKANYKALRDSTTYYKNKLGQTVATKLALQLTKKQLLSSQTENKSLKAHIKRFKKPIIIIETTQVISLPIIEGVFSNPIKCDFRRDIKVLDKYYSFNQTITQNGYKIDNFAIYNTQNILGGWKKTGLFKNPELRVDIVNSNRYIIQTDIKPTFITYKKKWHEKAYITIPLGFLIGKIKSKN